MTTDSHHRKIIIGNIGLEAANDILYQLYQNPTVKSLVFTHHFIGVALESMEQERAERAAAAGRVETEYLGKEKGISI